MGITLWQSLSDHAEERARDAFKDIHSLEDWARIRPQRQKEFLRALGLDPLPVRCDLKITEYGGFSGPGYRARRIAFQMLPDCWSSAHIYYPNPLPAGKAPGVLYVCGHGSIGTYHYQYHPMMWARRGYVCLILDTVEQHDNPGEHHGASMGRNDAWLSLGYTPAGTEVWNAMRALDVLEADRHVDSVRLGVTGVSGGGACSFHVAVVDERLKAVSTLCGISSPLDAITNGHLADHCDCMYPLNLFARDISEYAALIAPRAALFCFAEHDSLFHPAESAAMVERARTVYRLYRQEERCHLTLTPGPHGDHVAFDNATAAWFDQFLAGESRPTVARGEREQPEVTVSVFNGHPPALNRVDLLPQLIVPRGTVALPRTAEEWPAIRRNAIDRLSTDILGPAARCKLNASLALDAEWQCRLEPDVTLLRAHRGQINGMSVWLHMATPPQSRPALVLSIANEGESSQHAMARVACSLPEPLTVCYAGFQPRVAGANSVASELGRPRAPGSRCLRSVRLLTRQATALTGMTPVMMTIQDIGVAVNYLLARPETTGHALYLYGKGESGAAALYYALTDERIAGVVLDDLPSSHLDGSPILGILRLFDVPQAVGLMAPRRTALINPGHGFWAWPVRAYERLGCPQNFILATNPLVALQKVIA